MHIDYRPAVDHLDLHVWMSLTEFRQRRHQDVSRYARRHSDLERACCAAVLQFRCSVKQPHAVEHIACEKQHLRAFGAQTQLARRPVKGHQAHLTFEFGDGMADSGRCDEEQPRCLGETACIGHLDEDLQASQSIHGILAHFDS
jgi:hypothetical protein